MNKLKIVSACNLRGEKVELNEEKVIGSFNYACLSSGLSIVGKFHEYDARIRWI